MRKISILFFVLFCNLCFSQRIAGVYARFAIKGIGDATELSESAKKPIYYRYEFSGNKSLQEQIEGGGITIDTVYKEYKEVPGEKIASIVTTNKASKGFYFKDFTTLNYKVYFKLDNKETYVSDVLPNYKWEFVNESKIISGYKCKKAVAEKRILRKTQNIVAWYCEDIPINDGPMDFNGLPGFIIQIEINDTAILKFEKLKITSNESTEIQLPEIAVKQISIKEYEAAVLNGN